MVYTFVSAKSGRVKILLQDVYMKHSSPTQNRGNCNRHSIPYRKGIIGKLCVPKSVKIVPALHEPHVHVFT